MGNNPMINRALPTDFSHFALIGIVRMPNFHADVAADARTGAQSRHRFWQIVRFRMLGADFMNSLLALSAALVAIAAVPASAQQASNWTGFYVGANAGYAWGDSDVSTSTECPANGYYCTPGAGLGNVAAITADGSRSL